MKRFAMALALMCALSTPIFAGNMPTGGRSEPPPPGETHTPPGETNTPPTGETQGPNILVMVILTIITLPR